MSPRVIGVLRHFLPEFLRGRPSLTPVQWRAIRAITQWVERELTKRIQAPYYMATFTLPSELREMFFGSLAKEVYDLFFAAAAASLRQCLSNPKWLGANTGGFTAILHTWNQQLLFHPHLHIIVPAAWIDPIGRVIVSKNDKFLVPVPALQAAFRHQFREALKALNWEVDPAVWRIDWGINIQPFGSGTNAIKYLGAYVCRTAIGDSRIVTHDDKTVTFRWKNRAKNPHSNRSETMALTGVEFIRRYLCHVLPPKMHSIRYYGFHHPAAKTERERIAFHSGLPLVLGTAATNKEKTANKQSGIPDCLCCGQPMTRSRTFPAHRLFLPWPERAPPNKAPPP